MWCDSYYDTQRDIITITVLGIIFASIAYFCFVFFSEVWTTIQHSRDAKSDSLRKKSRRGSGKDDANDGGSSRHLRLSDKRRQREVFGNADAVFDGNDDSDVAAAFNPMFQAQASTPTGAKVARPEDDMGLEQLRDTTADMRVQIEQLTSENRELKGDKERLEGIVAGRMDAVERSVQPVRQEFKGMRASNAVASERRRSAKRRAGGKRTLRTITKPASSPRKRGAPPPPPPPPK